MKKIDMTYYEVQTDKVEDNIGMIVLSDLHSNIYGINLKKVEDMIALENPDFIVIAGDMINCHYKDDPSEVGLFLVELCKKYPVFYGFGNHESNMRKSEYLNDRWKMFQEYLQENGMTFLEDDTVTLEKNNSKILLSGVNIDSIFYLKTHKPIMGQSLIDKHLGNADLSLYNVLIGHNPDFFHRYSEWGADLVLSGHIHGGMVRLPFLGGLISTNIRLFPFFDAGEYIYNKSTMILSRGLGAHTIKLRIHNHPEVVSVKILANKQD